MIYAAFGPATTTTASGATTLNTSSLDATYAGYGSNATPLDRLAGYTIRLDAQVLSETTSTANRAGFSLLAVSSDLRAIELGFQPGRVFAQGDDPLFVAAEATTGFDPTAAHRYDLTVLGSTYSLAADGATILTGPLRDYTAFPGLSLLGGLINLDPYEVPNSIFIGDDTTSTGGATTFSYVAVSVPEPTTLAGLATLVLVVRRRR